MLKVYYKDGVEIDVEEPETEMEEKPEMEVEGETEDKEDIDSPEEVAAFEAELEKFKK